MVVNTNKLLKILDFSQVLLERLQIPLYSKQHSGKTFNKAVHFMVYECPSAKLHGEQREYAKGVPPFRTVAECMAWGMSDDVHTLTPEEWKKLVPLEHES